MNISVLNPIQWLISNIESKRRNYNPILWFFLLYVLGLFLIVIPVSISIFIFITPLDKLDLLSFILIVSFITIGYGLFSLEWAKRVSFREAMNSLNKDEIDFLDNCLKKHNYNLMINKVSEKPLYYFLQEKGVLRVSKQEKQLNIIIDKSFIKFYKEQRKSIFIYIDEIKKVKQRAYK